ncbi:MAG TPA: glutamine synthetase III [Deltaproteobacteria bacterium]|nr:glutamine synthetase III [Deltaproteobacteria bacterium]HPR54499.1 glutamine synthetase III [Deltaproteobacteria bacterium]HXK46607.1 glutamine synthetase III [Deltaproteobacteria bacterium]
MKASNTFAAYERSYFIEKEKEVQVSKYYGEDIFSTKVMMEKLPKGVYRKVIEIINEGSKLDLDTANSVAHAIKEWAIDKGATHYCHWFQPMTGTTAEKHDSFIEFTDAGDVIERFSGKQLIQGEPDASSFPSGGLRSTFEARGYTAWDPTSPAFIIKNGLGTTLCIPTIFISYTGEALDKKTPLLRSIDAINRSAVNLLRLLGNNESKKVFATLGPEQEYFLIDQDYYYKRQDLVLSGRSLLGAAPPKGQQLEDQYFGSIKERILSFMHDVEEELYKLGIPAKTRHNEVAPSQFEIAPIFEEANLAADHNQLVMETMKRVAMNHKLSLLLHEKPFAGINGSGKHLNWSLSDDLGNNLLNPGRTPHDNIQFLVFLMATIKAVNVHADLLRASVASAGNDHRLGANEAPPAIISVFLGEQLTQILDDIEKGKISKATDEAIIDLGVSKLPVLSKDSTDRNRTSPFAFTGNKFEFRAVGSSQSISFPATALNTIVAESLDILATKIKVKAKGGNVSQAALDVIKEEVKANKAILFMGDNYTKEWEAEAAKRKLPNKKTSGEALKDLITDKAFKLFEKYGVLSSVELKSRYHVRLERYIKEVDIEAVTLANMVQNQILPAALQYQRVVAGSVRSAIEVIGDGRGLKPQKELVKTLSSLIGDTQRLVSELNLRIDKANAISSEEKKASYICSEIKKTMLDIREKVDTLEHYVDNELWPIPKYWEMLFIS